VLIRKDRGLTRESLLEALSLGHCFISFDLFGDASGFDFSVMSVDKTMGDEIALSNQPRFVVQTPLSSRVVLFKNSVPIDQKSGTSMEFSPNGAGTYRVEAYLDSLPAPVTGQPWIVSNSIYIR
jgi:hypothetical protein